MPKMTKVQANIVADMLEGDERDAFMRIAGITDMVGEVTEETLLYLESIGLTRRDTNLLDGKSLVLLTANGKKVAECMQGGR